MTQDTVESVREQILAQLETLAAEITHANGYWNELTAEQITRKWIGLEQIESAQTPFLLIISGIDGPSRPVMEHGDESDLQVFLIGFVTSEDPDKLDREAERFLKDVRKMILQKGTDLTLGLSSVCDVKIVSGRADGGVVGFENWAVVELELTVVHRYAHSSP